ncbi:MAG: glycogen/starch synthase [Candidatus Aminicenantes bacterium]
MTYVSAEIYPFAKSGESADVASSLPKYLSHLGMQVTIFMPKYRRPEVESLPMERVMSKLLVPVGEERIKAAVYKSELGKCDIYFIDSPKFFWRDNIYGTGQEEYLDNDERFTFFNRAVLEFMLKTKMPVDVIHCNSWPTALIPVFLRTHYSHKSLFKNTATVFTLHNVAYQGTFPPESLTLTGLNWNYFNPKQLAFNGKFNFLKAGVMFSDVLSTVSSAYKKEIQTEKHGWGLEGILKKRKDAFYSIRNGVDYEIWNPETDPYIAANYSASDLKGKKKCKLDLIKEFGLSISSKTPLIGFVSYLSTQKGLDLLIEAMDKLMEMKAGLVVLGRGDEKYERQIKAIQKKYPGKMAVKFDLGPVLSHKIAAGVDISLIPSLYEPCGLNQLYSFKYGTVPVVRATGGLGETVKPFSPKTLKGNGFVFKEYSSRALLRTLKKALSCYEEPELWQKIMQAGFRENFSWHKAAKKYAKLYHSALEIKRGG